MIESFGRRPKYLHSACQEAVNIHGMIHGINFIAIETRDAMTKNGIISRRWRINK